MTIVFDATSPVTAMRSFASSGARARQRWWAHQEETDGSRDQGGGAESTRGLIKRTGMRDTLIPGSRGDFRERLQRRRTTARMYRLRLNVISRQRVNCVYSVRTSTQFRAVRWNLRGKVPGCRATCRVGGYYRYSYSYSYPLAHFNSIPTPERRQSERQTGGRAPRSS